MVRVERKVVKMNLIKSARFGNVQCDLYSDNDQIWMTREQIGTALEYTDPMRAISKLHARYKDRLDKFSVVTKLTTTDGKSYNTNLYNAKGVYEICRWSRQPKADAFYDFVYDLLEGLRKGETKLLSESKQQELEIKRMNAEARLLNARTRQATLILKSKNGKLLHPKAVELLQINAMEVITGGVVAERPVVEKTYSAADIGGADLPPCRSNRQSVRCHMVST